MLNSYLSSMPTYAMSMYLLPLNVMEKLIGPGNIFFGKGEEEKRVPLTEIIFFSLNLERKAGMGIKYLKK